MRHLVRILAALLLGSMSVFAAGLPASAQACDQQGSGYGASGVCVVNVVRATPSCTASGVFQLAYKVTAETPTVDLQWLGSGGAVVQSGQPLSGTVTWPSSIPKSTTTVRFVAGGTADVVVNPDAAVAACMPVTAASEVLATTPKTSTPKTSTPHSSSVLALTGAEVVPYVAAGGGLLLVGIAIMLFRAARQRRVTQ